MARNVFNESATDQAIREFEEANPSPLPQSLPFPGGPAAPSSASPRDQRMPSAAPAGRAAPADLVPMFEAASTRHGVPINVLMGIAEQESGYNTRAVGPSTQWGNAKGLMQYLDSTARGLGINPYDPAQAIDAAARQIRERLDRGYNMRDAVQEHFAGPNRNLWGPKTRRYGDEVLSRVERIAGELGDRYNPNAISRQVEAARDPDRPVEDTPQADDRGGLGFAADTGRRLESSLIRGSGALVRGIAQLQRIARDIPLIGQFAADPGVAELAANVAAAQAKRVEAGISPQARRAFEQSMPDGDLFRPSTWSLGQNPSLEGYMALGVDVFGSMLPVVAASIATGGSAVAGAAVGGLQGGGAAVESARELIGNMARTRAEDGKTVLERESPYYRELIAQGASPDEAARRTAEAAERLAFLFTTPVSAAGGALTAKIVHPASGLAGRLPLPGRVGARAALGAVEEGSQEAAETVATRQGVNSGAGTSLDITEGTFGDFVLGALGGAVPGAAAGAASSRQSGTPAPANAPPADVAPAAGPAPAPLPAADSPPPAPQGPLTRAVGQQTATTQNAGQNVRIETDGMDPIEGSVEYETPDGVMVRTADGEQLLVTREEIASGEARLVVQDDAVPTPAESTEVATAPENAPPEAVSAQDEVGPEAPGEAAAPSAPQEAQGEARPASPAPKPSTEDQKAEGIRRAFEIGENGATEDLRNRMWDAAQKGEDVVSGVREAALTAARRAREAGGLRTRKQFDAFMDDWSKAGIGLKGADLGRARRLVVEKHTPARPAAEAAPAPQRPAPRVNEGFDYDNATEPQLRERLKYLAQQSSAANGGTGKLILAERKKTEAAIDRLTAAAQRAQESKADLLGRQIAGAKKVRKGASIAEIDQGRQNIRVAREMLDAMRKEGAEGVTERAAEIDAAEARLEKLHDQWNAQRAGEKKPAKKAAKPSAPAEKPAKKALREARPDLGPTFDDPQGLTQQRAVLNAVAEGRGKALPDGARNWLVRNGFATEGRGRDLKLTDKGEDARNKRTPEEDRTWRAERGVPEAALAVADAARAIHPEGSWLITSDGGGPYRVAEVVGTKGHDFETGGETAEGAAHIGTHSARDIAHYGEDRLRDHMGTHSIRTIEGGRVHGYNDTVLIAISEAEADAIMAEANGMSPQSIVEREARRRLAKAPKAKTEPAKSGNTVFTDDAAEKARAVLRRKLSQLNNVGIDPEMFQAGVTLAGYHIEKGARAFTAYARAMVDDLGEVVRPYLKSWYMGVKYDPRASGFEGMSGAAEVDAADLDAILNVEAESGERGPADGAERGAAVSGDEERPGGAAQHDAAPAHSGDVAEEQSADVGPADGSGDRVEAGLRVPGEDVAPEGRAGEGRDASDGRAGDGGAGESDARGRGRGRARDRKRDRAPAAAATVAAVPEVSPAQPAADFHIENPLEIVGGGPVARFGRNQQAIELFNALREADRNATPEEQRILAGYTGWGSFGQELFQGTWERPMPKAGWEERDRWLRDHLGEAEWKSAQRSITNAHYTDPPTVMAMWDMARRMGFQGGRVLEPSMGIGNFFGMMPADLKARSRLNGIEMDSLTGGMAKLLYPASNVRVMPYQDSRTPDGFFDMVIGNWPFENTVVADRRYNQLSPFLHDYFFLKALDQTRPGGIVMGITSAGTMDKQSPRIRAAMAKKAELVASIRLPSGAFQDYAGTKVVTDIIILRRRDTDLTAVPTDAGWINTEKVKTPSGQEISVNEFYAANPQHITGTLDYGHGTTTGRPGMIVHRPENMAERLRQAVEMVPEGVYAPNRAPARQISYITNHTADREGSLTVQDGGLYVVRGEQLAPAAEVLKYAVANKAETAAREAQLRSLIDMRRLYAGLIEAERGGRDAEAERKALKAAYDAFTGEHGSLTDSFGLKYLDRLSDPFYPALAALETKGKPAAILTASTMRGKPALENPGPEDAFILARNEAVSPTLADVAARSGRPAEEVKAALIQAGAVFETVDGDIVPSDIYLSGNVREKLRQAEAAVGEGMSHLQRNVDALREVQPPNVPYFQIEAQVGATWVPPATYADFVAHMLNLPASTGIAVTFTSGRWKVRLADGMNRRPEAVTGYGSGHKPFSAIVNAAFSNQTITVKAKDTDGKEFVDTAATEEVNARIAKIRADFADWLWSDPERRVNLEHEYNEVRNAYATPRFDGSFLRFEGMALSLGNGPFDLRQHQRNAIWRALVNRRSINAHEVGTGKTFTMGGIAVESRRYGIAKKPMILAHNANSKAVASEIQMMYPAAKVLYIDNLSPDVIDVRLRQIANDDWDAVVVPHSLIDRFSMRQDTLMEMAQEEIQALEEEAYAAAKDDNETLTEEMLNDEEALKKLRSPTAKELVKARNRILSTIDQQAQRASREGAVSFEDLGIDMILVDEAHEFKKPPISTRMKMKGLQTQTSNRSIALQFLTRYIRAQNNGGNVHTFTGTPVTNTLTEVFHQMRYVMEDEMKAAGVDTWDAWFGSFAKEVQDVELSAAGEYEAVTRLAGFINVPELRRMIGQYMDVVFADDMPEMKPRQTASGKTLTSPNLTEAERAELMNGRTEGATGRPYKKVVNVTSDLTPEQKTIFARLQGYAKSWRSMTPLARKKAMLEGSPESPIVTEGLANKASFDVRMMDGEENAGKEGRTEDDPGSKSSRVVENVVRIYRSHPLANQVVFAEQGFSTRATRSAGRDASGAKQRKTVPTFSTVRDIVARLREAGIPAEQIAVVDGSTSKDKRKEIADAMNTGAIRVVIGSTDTLGVGVNMQRNLRAMHHMDAPYMPGDLEQRNGRGLRQGNQWNTVEEYRYMTDRLDGRRWQILAIKQRFINAFLKANADTRVIEGEAAADEQSDILQSFSEAAGDPRVLIREKLRKNLEALQRSERQHTMGVAEAAAGARRLKGRLYSERNDLEVIEENKAEQAARDLMEAQRGEGFRAEIGGTEYAKRLEAEGAITDYIGENVRLGQPAQIIGEYGGHALSIEWPAGATSPHLSLELAGETFTGRSLRGLESGIRSFPERVRAMRAAAGRTASSLARMEEVAAAPFGRAKELGDAQARLVALEKDIAVNPVPPPAWLRAGAPVDSGAFWKGREFTVTGHRWTGDGWFVLGQDAKGTMTIPYSEVTDGQGVPLYEARTFEPPVVVEKLAAEPKASVAEGAPEGIGTTEALDGTLRAGEFGAEIGAMIDAGQIVLHDRSADLPGAAARKERLWREVANATVTREARTMREAEAVATEAFRGKELTNAATGIRAVVSGKTLGKMTSPSALRKSASSQVHAMAVANVDQLFERAALGWTKPDGKGDTNTAKVHRFFAPLLVNGRAYLSKITVKETIFPNEKNPLYSIEAVDFEGLPSAEAWTAATVQSDGIDPTSAPHAEGILNLASAVQDFNENRIGGTVQAVTTRDGKIHLAADALDANAALPVVLHEMFHAGAEALTGQKGWAALMSRLQTMLDAAERRRATGEAPAGRSAAFWDAALARVEQAGVPEGQRLEELAAYAVEMQEQAPPGVAEVARRLVGQLKAWLLHRFGKQFGAVTPQQLRALTVAALQRRRTAPRQAEAFSQVPQPGAGVDLPPEGRFRDALRSVLDRAEPHVLGAIPIRPLLEEMASYLPSAQAFLRTKQEMDAMRSKWFATTSDVSNRWLKYRSGNKAENAELMAIMHESTLAQLDPSKPFQASQNEALDVDRRPAYDRLKARFDKLSPEAKALYNEVRDTYSELADAFDAALMASVEKAVQVRARQAERKHRREMSRIEASTRMSDEQKAAAREAADRTLKREKTITRMNKGARMYRLRVQFESNRLAGPYFPLARFGDFYVTARDEDGNVASFSMFERSSDQIRFARQMQREGYQVEYDRVSKDADSLRKQVDPSFVAEVEGLLEGANAPADLKDEIWQRFLQRMPDLSIRTSRIHRKGTAGFNADAIRAFGHHMFHGSHQIARLTHAMDLQNHVEEAREEAKDSGKPNTAIAVVNEMARRMEFIMNPTGGALAHSLTSLGFIYHLSASPAAALVNLTQTTILGIPHLAAYEGSWAAGFAKATAQLTRAMKDFTAGLGHADRSSSLTDDERDLINRIYENGLADRTQAHDLAGVAETGVRYSATRFKVMSALSYAYHHAERANREVTALAAYRMARGKGLGHEAAIEDANRLTWKIHFDYQNTSRPRYMQNDTAKVLLLFRNFTVNMLFRLFRDVHQATAGESAEVRKEARMQLVGTTMMLMSHAGIRGVWGFGLAMMMAGIFFGGGDDAEDELRKWMQRNLGNTATAVLMDGIPGWAAGVSISERIGMPDLWFRSPDRQLEGKDALLYLAESVLGPLFGIVKNGISAVSIAREGNVTRGLETVAPKAVKDIMRAARFHQEGALNLRGDALIESMPLQDVIKQAIGFTPARLAEVYAQNSSAKNMEQRILKDRQRLLTQYDRAFRQEDVGELRRLEGQIDRFNDLYPEKVITTRSLLQSIRTRERLRQQSATGIRIDPKLDERVRGNLPAPSYN